jgi:hypothetical protein
VQLGSTTLTSWPSTCNDAGHKLQFVNGGFTCGCEFGFLSNPSTGGCTPPVTNTSNSTSGGVSTISLAGGATVVAGSALFTDAVSVAGTLAVTGASSLGGALNVTGILRVAGNSITAPPNCTGTGLVLRYNGSSYNCMCSYTNTEVTLGGNSVGSGAYFSPCTAPATLAAPTGCPTGQMLSYSSMGAGGWTCVSIVAVTSSSPNGFYLNQGVSPSVYQCTGSSYLQYDTSQIALGNNPWGCYVPQGPPQPNACSGPGLALQRTSSSTPSWQCICIYTGAEYMDSASSPACVAPASAAAASPSPAAGIASLAYVREGWNSLMVQNCTTSQDCQPDFSGTTYRYLYDAPDSGAICLDGVCVDDTQTPPKALRLMNRFLQNVIDGDTTTCSQFLNYNCYAGSGTTAVAPSYLGQQSETTETICDAYVTIDLGATYMLSGITIYGTTANADDVVNVLALSISATAQTYGGEPGDAYDGTVASAPNFGVHTDSSYTLGGLFSSSATNRSPGWATSTYCCGGTTGVPCPTSGTSVGRCPPPYLSSSKYNLPSWTDSREAFKNGYTFDFIQPTYQVGLSSTPQFSPAYTRFITVVVNAGKPGAAGSSWLNLCEVEVRGKILNA